MLGLSCIAVLVVSDWLRFPAGKFCLLFLSVSEPPNQLICNEATISLWPSCPAHHPDPRKYIKKLRTNIKKRSRSPVVSMPPPARPSSLLSLLSGLSVRVLLRCRPNVPKEICPQWLSPKQPWSGEAASYIHAHNFLVNIFTAVFGGRRAGKRF